MASRRAEATLLPLDFDPDQQFSVWKANKLKGVVAETLSVGLWGQNHFCSSTETLLAFQTEVVFVLMVQRQHRSACSCLRVHHSRATTVCRGHCLLHSQTPLVKEKAGFSTNCLDEARQRINFMKSWCLCKCLFHSLGEEVGRKHKALVPHSSAVQALTGKHRCTAAARCARCSCTAQCPLS